MTDPNVYRNTPPGPRPVPEGTSVSTPYIWAIVFAPLLVLLPLLLWDVEGYMTEVIDSSMSTTAMPTYLFDPGYLALQGVSLVVWLGSVLLAFFDWRELKRRDVDRPFHWAWTFLGGLVYVIGRSIIVHRRSGTGFAPMWVAILVTVLGTIVSMWVTVGAMAAAFTNITFGP
ncbi:hypothetical protein [Marisediminicola sp. LYQ134]|uniref:hypothetical protein n=1 Tax=unclassified Marisediminicola TaxID=2618316 RepID=UPI00398335A6